MHYKRRRRRRAGIKGCCGMCMLRTTTGKRTSRKLTRAEWDALEAAREQYADAGLAPPSLPGRSRSPG